MYGNTDTVGRGNLVNMDVNNGRSIRKLVKMGKECGDVQTVRVRATEFTNVQKEVDLIEMYYKLVVCSTYLKDEAYSFLVEGKTYNQIMMKYNIKRGYLRNIIYNETRRLFDEIQLDPLASLIKGELTPGVVDATASRINEKLEMENSREKNRVERLFTFDIQETATIDREFNRNVKEQEFKELVSLLRYYVKPYQETVLEQINEKHIGYILHLLQTDDSSLLEEDRRRKQYLKMGWMLK